jgi:hypothetical protein
MDQYKTSEYNYGFLLNYIVKESHESILGFSLLNTSTAVYQFGLIIKGTNFRASYSMPLNFTRNYSNKGLEFSLIHIFNKSEVKVKMETINEKQPL